MENIFLKKINKNKNLQNMYSHRVYMVLREGGTMKDSEVEYRVLGTRRQGSEAGMQLSKCVA